MINTLKITDINRPLTERHDLERAKITEAEILGRKHKIYNLCNHRGKTYMAEKGCERRMSVQGDEKPQVLSKEYVGEERKLITSLIYEEGGLRTAW